VARLRKSSATFALLLLLFAGLSAQTAAPRTGLLSERGLTAAAYPQIQKLAENVYVWSDVHPNGLYLTNDLIVLTADGVLVADGQKDVPTTKKMVDRIRTMTAQPIRYVAVCSEHGDHTGGNAAFPPGTVFVSKPAILNLGGTEIRIVDNGRAHTGTDLEVYLPAEKIFFVSEVFSNHIFPNMRTAAPTEWVQTLKKVQQADARWVIPGHGFIDSPETLKEELANFAAATAFIVSEVTRVHATGAGVEAGLAQANWGPYASWPVFDRNGPMAFQRIYDELDGKLK
jgi:glyoxylase-like metal-dependent hydrolase (beta-lactamase superfamily II)